MNALRSVLNNSEDEERGIIDEINQATTLSLTTRLKCFVACFLIGVLFSVLGSIVLFVSITNNLAPFSVFYTLGSITSMASTMFLMGPYKQLKNMFAEKRLIATIVALSAIVLTLVAAFVVKSAALALLMIVIQFLALTWYSISYIPFARNAVRSIIVKCCC